MTGRPPLGLARQARPANPRRAAQPTAINAVTLRMQETLAQMKDLKRTLVASRREVAVLARANADLANSTEHEFGVSGSESQRLPRDLSGMWSPAGRIESQLGPLIEALRPNPIRLRHNHVLYRVGDRFTAIFAIHAGSCKVVLMTSGGQEQVGGFHMTGEIIGIDGIGTGFHDSQAIALEETEVYRLPFDQIEHIVRIAGHIGHNLYKLLSQETVRTHTMMVALGTMRAEQRLAMFLLDLSHRYQARGYSSSEFILRLTRQEIGSYLGLKLETVSRMFSRFQRDGLIQVEGRRVKLLDRVAVNQLLN